MLETAFARLGPRNRVLDFDSVAGTEAALTGGRGQKARDPWTCATFKRSPRSISRRDDPTWPLGVRWQSCRAAAGFLTGPE
jgi:hypothetical protein